MRGHRFVLAVFLTLLVPAPRPITAQSTPKGTLADSGSLDEQLATAARLVAERKGDAAFPLMERALAAAVASGLEPQEASARCGIAEILISRAQYAAAREHATKALEIFERHGISDGVGRANHALSVIKDFSGNLSAARTHAQRAVDSYQWTRNLRARAVATLQLLRVDPLTPDRRGALYDRVLADAAAIQDADLQAKTLHGLGDERFTAGMYEAAVDALGRAEELLRRSGDNVTLGTVYNSIGRVYRAHGRLDEALRFQRQALALHEKGADPFALLQSLNAVATVYQRMGDLGAARRYYERALALAAKTSSPRVRDLVRANLATLLVAQGQFASGAAALEQVIANGLDIYLSRRHSVLSAAYGNLGRPRDALAAAGKAVDSCANDENACIPALGRRAAAHMALGDAPAALADITTALGNLETVRSRLVPTDFFKREFNNVQQDIYSQAISLQMRERQERQALETAELARSRGFLDLLASRDLRAPDTDSVPRLSSTNDADRRSAVPQIAGSSAAAADVPVLQGGAAPAGADRSSGTVELRSTAIAAPSVADDLVATAARLRSTLLVYWVGEAELSIWAVMPGGSIHARRVPVLANRLRELVRQTDPFVAPATGRPGPARTITTRGASTIDPQSGTTAAWRTLYDLVIQPVKPVLPKQPRALLTIVPHGPLVSLSFAALQGPTGSRLLEDYALHYAPAGAVLKFTAAKKQAVARTGEMLVVADPVLPAVNKLDRPLTRLAGARSEAAAIARLVPPERLTVMQDVLATETRTREVSAGKAVVHFATHAVVTDEDPFGSYLALAPSSGGRPGDGKLTSQEVYGLRLDADLVVLSACRSAGGRVTGDGISALARAFFYAGTASLIASVWDVADEPTNRLLPDFYRRWLAGQSKSSALQAAQLQLLRDLRAGRVRISTPAGIVTIPEHPVFWAGFALFGEPE